jgi:predicted acylesterase/phospholipase RssA
MTLLRFLIVWGRRLPAGFSVPLVLLLGIYVWVVASALERLGAQSLGNLVWNLLTRATGLPDDVPSLVFVMVLTEGVAVAALLLAGTIACYNLAAAFHRRLRRTPRIAVIPPTAPAASGEGPKGRLQRFERIGIILAGGGAKGCYQAGALKAIHEFLEEHGALDRVRMIAGTSIGSWNAMFWLAGLIKAPAPGQPSMHEAWWRSVRLDRLVEFAAYWPMARNYLLLTTPWREGFRTIFGHDEVRSRLENLCSPASTIHFYFTRANVERGHLEFSTNWDGVGGLTRQNYRTMNAADRVPVVPSDRYQVIGGASGRDSLRRMEDAVFASMDLPPLFPYSRIRTDMPEWFEDGGVVDNVPVWFGTQLETCDLLFVLPLNATFNARADFSSLARRLFRVMDVRQGVLEKNAMKLAYLYNELAAARSHAAGPTGGQELLAQRAARREHKPVSVFAICPGQPLAVGTTEFWKTREAGDAFDLMYAETKYELRDRFEDATDPGWLRMAIVQPEGGRVYLDEF